jgi:hypothetical protein
MNKELNTILLAAIIIYLFVGEFLSFLFWFEYAQTHGFFNTLFIGFFVSQFKGLFWPFFI